MSFAPARGNGRGRGRWRGGIKSTSMAKDFTTETPGPLHGNLFDTIRLADLEKPASDLKDTAVIHNPVTVASFNWIRAGKPTIVIPGSPPRWSPPSGATQLREDQGSFFRDRNAAQYPRHPIEPVIIAAIYANADLASGIDIVACSSTLGNLLRFVRHEEKSFRILVEMIDRTMFFVRRENSPTELIKGVRGYGHSFPEAYTTWNPDIKQPLSHQRLVRYHFGGLKLLVRFEADGYLPIPQNRTSKPSTTKTNTGGHFCVEDLTRSFKVEIEGGSVITPSGNDEVMVKRGGESVSQDHIFDLKTRSLWKKNQELLKEELPRLWVAQIGNFVTAYHERGMFKPENIDVQDVRKDVARWEKDHNTILAQLAALLNDLVSRARGVKDGRFEICRSENGELELRRQLPDAGDALSKTVKQQWIRSAADSEEVAAVEDATKTLLSWDDGSDNDYTACGDGCGYCGRCTY